MGNKKRKFQLATYYSPPNEKLPLNIFNNILKRNPDTIICGDLNAKHDSWSNTDNNEKGHVLFDWLNDKFLYVVNKFVPTSTRSSAVIDLILAPISMLSNSFTVLPSVGSDHQPIIWSPPFNIPAKDSFIPIKRTYWSLFELFITFISSYWDKLCSNMPDKTKFITLYERFLALSVARLTYVSYLKVYRPSIPQNVVNLIQIKRFYLDLARKTKLPYFILQLKLYSNYIRKVLFVHKRQMWSDHCATFNNCNVKEFWRKSRRHFSSFSPSVEGILHNGIPVTSPPEMCDIAMKFYQEQFTEHKNNQSLIEIEADLIDQKLNQELQVIHPDHNFYVKFHDLKRLISRLKNKNSTGLDGVSNKIIKLLPSNHLVFITTTFNYMIQNLKYPQHWHTAKMVLLSKTKSSMVEISDSRPISLLPCLSKLYEKVFLLHFQKWILNAGILPEEQTGFQAGHNMATRIVTIVDQIGRGLTLNTAAAALFIDFKSAFNQMWFKGLWMKLQQLHCPKYIIAWLRNYLTNRSAYIEVKENRSNCFSLYKGVPQDSCVGPVLFIVYNYDLLTAVPNLYNKHLYADDLAIVFTPSAIWSSKQLVPHLSQHVTQVIKGLLNYSITWKQPINFKKTFWTLFHKQVSPKIPVIYCEGHTIEHVSKFKYLGTFLDTKLSFKYHLNYIQSKISKNIAVFKRILSSRMLPESLF